jgi:hypothetical protein
MRFKAIVFAAVFITMFCLPDAQAADDQEKLANDFRELIEKLPPQAILSKSMSILNNENVQGRESKDAEGYYQIAKEIAPKIRKLLKVGTSVFAYPGLLAHGAISYGKIIPKGPNKYEFGYSLYVGMSHGTEGIGRSDFKILFDETGIIKSIENKEVESAHEPSGKKLI